MHNRQLPMSRNCKCDWDRVDTPVLYNKVTILLVRVVLDSQTSFIVISIQMTLFKDQTNRVRLIMKIKLQF